MDADGGLLRLELVDGVFRLAVFFCDGEDAESSDGLKGIVWLRMEHADENRSKVRDVDESERRKSRNQNSFHDVARGEQKKGSSNPAK
jgi:hypothetical protein